MKSFSVFESGREWQKARRQQKLAYDCQARDRRRGVKKPFSFYLEKIRDEGISYQKSVYGESINGKVYWKLFDISFDDEWGDHGYREVVPVSKPSFAKMMARRNNIQKAVNEAYAFIREALIQTGGYSPTDAKRYCEMRKDKTSQFFEEFVVLCNKYEMDFDMGIDGVKVYY